MASSLSNLVDKLSEGHHSYKCTDCKSCLEYIPSINNYLVFRCLTCKKP